MSKACIGDLYLDIYIGLSNTLFMIMRFFLFFFFLLYFIFYLSAASFFFHQFEVWPIALK